MQIHFQKSCSQGDCSVRVDSDRKTWHLSLKCTWKKSFPREVEQAGPEVFIRNDGNREEMDLLLTAGKDVEMKHPKAAREGEGPSCWVQYWDFPKKSS